MPPSGEPSYRCPECGGDVCVTRELVRRWTHPTYLIPVIFWALTLCIVLAITSPWGNEWMGKTGIWTNESPIGRELNGTPNKPPLQLSVVRAAADGDLEAQRETIGLIRSRLDWYGPIEPDEKLVFIATGLAGIIHRQFRYGYGADWFTYWSNTTVDNMSDPDHSDMRNDSLSETSFRLYPPEYMRIEQDDSRTVYQTFSMLGALTFLSVCMIVIFMTEHALRIFGFSFNRRSKKIVLAILLLGAVSLSIVYPSDTSTFYSGTGGVKQRSDLLDRDELLAYLSDTNSQRSLVDLIADSFESVQETDSHVNLWLESSYSSAISYWTASAGLPYQLYWFKRKSYFERQSDTAYQRPIDPPASAIAGQRTTLNKLSGWELRLGGKKALYSVGVSPSTVALLTVAFYWFWKLAHGGGRRWMAMIQRKRVKRNQCIFCAYPLSPEALSARNAALQPTSSAPIEGNSRPTKGVVHQP